MTMPAIKMNPSSLDRLFACPGSAALIASLPEQPFEQSKAAEDGDRKHALAHWRAENPEAPWPTSVGTHKITSSNVTEVGKVIDHVKATKAFQHRGQIGYAVMPEQFAEVGRFCGIPDDLCRARIDLILADPNMVEVIDYKFGRYLVAPDIWELKANAIGALQFFIDPETGQFRPGFQQMKKLKLTILQPANPNVAASAEFPIEEIANWMRELSELYQRISGGQQPPRSAGDHCVFCPGKKKTGACPEYVASVKQSAHGMLTALGQEPAPVAASGPAPIGAVEEIASLAEQAQTADVASLDGEALSRAFSSAQDGIVRSYSVLPVDLEGALTYQTHVDVVEGEGHTGAFERIQAADLPFVLHSDDSDEFIVEPADSPESVLSGTKVFEEWWDKYGPVENEADAEEPNE